MVFTSNMGKIIAGLLRTPSAADNTVVLQDLGDVARAIHIYANSEQLGANAVSLNQIGQGTTPANRTDTNIETPFGVAPESALVGNGAGVFFTATGIVKIGFVIAPTGGAGTITEVAKINQFQITGGTFHNFLIIRTTDFTAVTFIAAQTLSVDQLIQI